MSIKYEPMDLSRFAGHTPGPWKGAHFPSRVEYVNGGCIAEVPSGNMINVSLLAAAPDLLAKLDEAQRKIAEMQEAGNMLANMLEQHQTERGEAMAIAAWRNT